MESSETLPADDCAQDPQKLCLWNNCALDPDSSETLLVDKLCMDPQILRSTSGITVHWILDSSETLLVDKST